MSADMVEPLRRPDAAPALAPARRRPALYTDHLPVQPWRQEQPPRDAEWVLRELARLAAVAVAVIALACFLWSRAG